MTEIPKLISAEGWHVLHLFYKVDHSAWSFLSDEEKFCARTNLSELVQEIRSTDDCQLLTFAMVTPKSDVGFMLLCADLQAASAFEKKLTISLGPDVLVPAYSFYSMTEKSEYTTPESEFVAELKATSAEGTPEFEKSLTEWRDRMAHYQKHRLYPVLPPWDVLLPDVEAPWSAGAKLVCDAVRGAQAAHVRPCKSGPPVERENPPAHHRLHGP